MTETEIYQQAAAHAFEKAIEADQVLRGNLRRLAVCKMMPAIESSKGKEYVMRRTKKPCILVCAGFEVAEHVDDFDRYTTFAIRIELAFVTDIEPMINKKGLTKAEIKLLKELKANRNKALSKAFTGYRSHGLYDYSKETFDRIEHIRDELRGLKNQLDVIDIACYEWDISQVLSADFMTKGLDYNGFFIGTSL